MIELTLNDTVLGQLRAPERNRYFYGKLLDVRHLEMEQGYAVTQRWLLNRLGTGSGVLCGLRLALGEGGVIVRPGVAIDGLGRVIVVPAAHCIEAPTQPTDTEGRSVGDPVVDGSTTIYLCYAECPRDPTPVLVGDCDSRNGFAPGTTVERFKIVVRAGPAEPPIGLTDEQCAALIAGTDLRLSACEVLAPDCSPSAKVCIPLGTITIDPEGVPTDVDQCGPRTTLYSNARLFDLIGCLAHRVAQCCAITSLQYVAGDAQKGKPGDVLPIALSAKVVDHTGSGVEGVDVTFHVQTGGTLDDGGAPAGSVVTSSAGGGLVSATLTLGDTNGPASVEATTADGGRVVFNAWAVGDSPGEPTPPVVLRLSPEPAEVVPFDDFAKSPVLRIAFDRPMDRADLESPEKWLRVWTVRDPGDGDTTLVRRMPLGFSDSGGGDSTAIYKVDPAADEERPMGVLVIVRAEDDAIRSADANPLLLDAEFGGTAVKPTLLRRVWEIDDEADLPRAVWDGLTDTGATLPKSGEGNPGGLFHSWFQLTPSN